MTDIRNNLLVLMAWGGVGCTTDGLYSAQRLNELSEVPPPPQTARWEMRWYMGFEDGLLADCQLHPAFFEPSEENWGEVISNGPHDVQPIYWLDEGAYRWAVGFPVMVDANRYSPVGEGWFESAPLDYGRGVWGASEDIALVFAEGDVEVFRDEILSIPLDDEDFWEADLSWDAGLWVNLLTQSAAATGRLEQSIVAIGEDQQVAIAAQGFSVVNTGLLPRPALELYSGVSVGGVLRECAP